MQDVDLLLVMVVMNQIHAVVVIDAIIAAVVQVVVRGLLGRRDLGGLKDRLDLREFRGFKGFKVNKVFQELMVPMELLD